MRKISFKHCLLAAMFLTPAAAVAQITAGSGKVPESFSVLELVSNQQRGLRLPHLTTAQRNAVEASDAFQREKLSQAMGLQIFNTTTRCVETWNGTVWIQSCPPEGPYTPSVPIGVASNCTITPRTGSNLVYTAKADPNAVAYEFFVGGISQGTQPGNVLTLAEEAVLAQVTVKYLYSEEFLKPTMIAVQGGTYAYQSLTQDSNDPPVPADANGVTSNVTVGNFFMSETEITQAQFEAVMGTNPAAFRCGGGNASAVTTRPTSALPVESANWYAAIAYCNKLSLLDGKTPVYSVQAGGVDIDWAELAYSAIPTSNNDDWNAAVQNPSANGYRLPTVVEWEYAARGGQQSESISGRNALDFYYSGSNDADEVAWYVSNNGRSYPVPTVEPWFGPKPVKTKKANVLGLYDMSGNVFEWCWEINNPWDSSRVIRSSYYGDGANYARVGMSGDLTPSLRSNQTGFRIICCSGE